LLKNLHSIYGDSMLLSFNVLKSNQIIDFFVLQSIQEQMLITPCKGSGAK